MKNLNLAKIQNIVDQFHRVKVLVVGDLILDEFIWGEVSRISPEAPIPVVWVKSESFIPGGACNVANNMRALDAKAEVIGVVGDEGRGRMLIDLLKEKKIGTTGIFKDSKRPTTLKSRVIAHHQQVVRIDREEIVQMSKALQNKILRKALALLPKVDAVCIEDYGKGVIGSDLVKQIVTAAKKSGKVITVDPKEDHLLYYKNVTSLTPNHLEASKLAQIPIKDDASLYKAGAKMLKILKSDHLLITLGEQGMCLFQKGCKPAKIPTLAQDVYDVSGAGDTVIGTFTIALALGAKPIEAAHLANCAAGIVVGKVGTATVTRQELLQRVKQFLENR